MLTKQNVNISFGMGLDTKTDPYQIGIGNFLELNNSVFNTGKRLSKRNGFSALKSLPVTTANYLTTFKGGLTAIGTQLDALSSDANIWVNKGSIQPISLSISKLIRSNTNQSQVDAVVAPNGLVCVVYTDNPTGGATYSYAVYDQATGQNVIPSTLIAAGSGTVTGSPRVFSLGNYFIIVFTNVISAANHLQYVAISSTAPYLPNGNVNITSAVDIASTYVPKTTLSWDGVVANNNLYLAYNTTTGGQAIKVTYISSTLSNPATAKTFASQICTMMSMCADLTTPSSPVIWLNYYDAAGSAANVIALDKLMNTVLAATQTLASGTVLNVACTAINAVATCYYEFSNTYSFDSGIHSNLVKKVTVTQAGSASGATVIARSVGLASKGFIYNGISYFLGVQASAYQNTYFLLNSSGNVITWFAYENASGYYTIGLPSVSVNGNTAYIAYFFKDLIESVNKGTNLASGTQTAQIYSQLGINLAAVEFTGSNLSVEIGSNLNICGGFVGAYDGNVVVEQGFFLWPENVETTPHTTGGSMADQVYYYQVVYQWTDAQGNIFNSAPSIPVIATVSGGSGSGSVTVNIPTLRMTYKIANPVRVKVYRWSTAQQNYYSITPSTAAPLFNSVTSDSVSIVDTASDSTILGNELIYTTGGVVENIAPPATNIISLFQSRLWLVDAEDPNVIWYSQLVIEGTPVQMSDLLTLYIAPTVSVDGSTGNITALYPMDDKLIIFKENSGAYYINGSGPDATGANSQFSEPVFITATVGCNNPQSLVMSPQGIIFQSNKGLWLLGRDLSTSYIGAPVELYNSAMVESSLNIPGTNQIRFTLNNGVTLMYDYFYNQWGTFTGIPAVSSTIYEALHSYIDQFGRVFQETPGLYLDNGSPVLMSFLTGWISVAGLQGFERFYSMLLLGNLYSPVKLNVAFAFDYNGSALENVVVYPQQISPAYGGLPFWGSGTQTNNTWGGGSLALKERIFPDKQKCESFQVAIQEFFDSSQSLPSGQGFSLSGLNLVVGLKKGTRTSSASESAG